MWRKFEKDFKDLIDIIDEFSKNKKNDIELDYKQDDDDGTNIKSFDDYVEDYINNQDRDGDKYTRRFIR